MTAQPEARQTRDAAVSSEEERLLERVNDPTALNGGSAWHWYAPGRPEQTSSARQRSKLLISIVIWGTLATGVLLLLATL